MFPRTCTRLLRGAAAAGVLFALSATLTSADDLVTQLGPVGNNEPILTNVGSKRVIAFYQHDGSSCALHTVTWDNSDTNDPMAKAGFDPADTAVRIRIGLKPGQIIHIDTADDYTLSLRCSENAQTLAIVDSDEHVAFGTSAPKYIKASASRY